MDASYIPLDLMSVLAVAAYSFAVGVGYNVGAYLIRKALPK